MPKHIIEFNLPEETAELAYALKGAAYSIALSNIDNHLRAILKYTEISEEHAEIYQAIRDFVRNEINEADNMD